MIQSWKLGLGSWLAISGAITSLSFANAWANCAYAQITPDATLPNNSIVTPNGSTLNITGGTQAGSNLFHSFGEFSVPTGSEAYFNNAVDIQNVISRVTGGSISNIDGIIRANGNANLFLINPNGIVFGANASLNVGGSFVASTANAIGFGNQGFFSATNPNTPELLTVNPSALLFNQIRAASIQNNSPSGLNPSSEFTAIGLRVPDGKSLLLIGGDIKMDGGGLFAVGGRVELGGLAGAGTVGLNGDGNNPSLSFPNSVERSDVFLSNGAGVNVSAGDGGSIAVNARNLEMTGESQLFAGIESGLGSDNSKAGNIEINATGAINLDNKSIIANQVLEASGQGGDVNISASTLQVEDKALVSVDTFGVGEGGSLTIETNTLLVQDGAVSADTFGTGKGGSLTIKTNTLLVRDGAQVGAGTFGAGKGGSLIVDASNVQLIGTSADGRFPSGLAVSTEPNSTGDAGDLTIKTNTLLVKDGAQVGTVTFGAGKGGSLKVDAIDIQLIGEAADGRFPSGLSASAQPNSTGDGGDLTIKTNTLLVKDGAQVGASTRGPGKGGSLTVDAIDIQLIGRSAYAWGSSGLFASANPNSTADAGDLTIKTNTLLVQDEAVVTVQSAGTGTAGNMTLDARSIRLDNNALLTANTQSPKVDPNREQATINIDSRDLIMSRNSNIRTNARGENVIGGNINIDTDLLIALQNSNITADAQAAFGGRLIIDTQGIFRTADSDITASSELGTQFNGTVDINILGNELNSGLINLPTVPVDTEVAQTCQPNTNQAQSEFVVTGRGGLPPSPDETLSSDAIQVDWVTLNPKVENRNQDVSTNTTTSEPNSMVEATGLMIAHNGDVILTASATPALPGKSRQTPANCHAKSSSYMH